MPKRTPPPARQRALTLLGRRPLSERELCARLTKEGYLDTDVQDALTMAREYRYVDDDALADAMVREACRTGHGPLWVYQSLYRRGVNKSLAAAAQQRAEMAALSSARALAQHRFGDLKLLPYADKGRAARYLASRGFTPKTITQALSLPE